MKKRCTKCGEVKWLCEFTSNRKNRRDGRSTQCRKCVNMRSRTHYQENRESHNDKGRVYYKNNKAKILKKQAKWAKANPDKERAAQERYRVANVTKILKRDKKYRDSLSDAYIRHLLWKLGLRAGQIGERLIKAKREEILFLRELKQFKKEIQNAVNAGA